MNKRDAALKSIGELCKILGLIDKATGKKKTYVIRFWEKNFKKAKPSILHKGRRYYSKDDVKFFIFLKTLIFDEGLRLNKVKKIVENNDKSKVDSKIDLYINHERILKIQKIIKEMKNIL